MKTINVDTLIIGSGVSAHLAAYFLSKKGVDYLIIESGVNKSEFLYKSNNNISDELKTSCGIGVGGGYDLWAKGLVNPSSNDDVDLDWNIASEAISFFNDGVDPSFLNDLEKSFKFNIEETITLQKQMMVVPKNGEHLDVFENFDTEKFIKKKTIYSFEVESISIENNTVKGRKYSDKYTINPKRILCCAGALGTPDVISTFDTNRDVEFSVFCEDHYMGYFARSSSDSSFEDEVQEEAYGISKKSYNVMHKDRAVTMYVRKKMSALCKLNFLQKVIEFSALGGNKYKLALQLLVSSPLNFIKFIMDLYILNKKDIFIVGKTKDTGSTYTVKNGIKTSKIHWNSGIDSENKKWIFNNIKDKKSLQIKKSAIISAAHPHNVKMNDVPVSDMDMPKHFHCIDNARLPTLLVSNTTLTNLYMLYSDMLSIYKTEKKV